MEEKNDDLKITCERLVLGKLPKTTELEHLARYEFAAKFVQQLDVADIACGSGYGTAMLAAASAKSVIGVDVSAEAVKFAASNYSKPHVRFIQQSAECLESLPSGSLDVIVSFETIEHLNSPEAYLDEIKRVLRPNGLFIVSTPDKRLASISHPFTARPTNPFHVREYTLDEFTALVENYFKVEKILGQSFIRPIYVLWPVQFLIKCVARLIPVAALRDKKESIYTAGFDFEVNEYHGRSIAKYWLLVARMKH